MRPNVLMALLFLGGCGLEAPQFGQGFSKGVGRARFEARANGTDVVAVQVLYPVDQQGTPKDGAHPAVVFIQGGGVPTSRYLWQGEALAREGYVVAFPAHAFNLALTGVENGEAARRLLTSPPPGSVLAGLVDPTRVAVAGHSLGAVVAMKLLLRGGFAALVAQAGYQDAADQPAVDALTRPTLFVSGTSDCSAGSGTVADRWSRVPPPTALVLVEGVSHYAFTDSLQEDLDRGCEPTASLEDAHRRIVATMLAFLPAAMVGQINATALRDAAGPQVQTR